MPKDRKATVFLVSHTHWDREWHQPFQAFRLRLVRLIDLLIRIMDSDPGFRHFHLDGQTVVLEDYLEMRPEREGDLKRLIRAGRIAVGPWYVLPDEYLVSGESLIRNLQFGIRIASRFGRTTLIGYLPDQFGHISQMPQILAGFGIGSAVVWRGLEYENTVHNEFLWEGPDGTRLLGIHLPPRGYGGVIDLSAEPARGLARVQQALGFLVPRSASGCVLVMNGDDHVFPDPGIPGFIGEIAKEMEVRHASLAEFITAVEARVDRAGLAVVRGELNSSRDTRVLQSVYSSRMPLKRMNRECEDELVGWAEPTSAAVMLIGHAPPRGELRTAWKWLLRNHPHDSIGGCSVDEVHRDMETRFGWSMGIARGVSAENLHAVAAAVDTGNADPDAPSVVVFNPTNFPGDQVVEVDLPAPLPAGPVHAAAPDGRPVPAEVVSAARVRFCAVDLPAFGYSTYRITPGAGAGDAGDLAGGARSIENAHYRVELSADGTIALHDRATDEVYSEGLRFEDRGDRGDEYTFDPIPGEVPIVSGPGEVAEVSVTRLRATMRVRSAIDLPAGLTQDRRARRSDRVRHEIETEISLRPGVRRIDFLVRFTNRAADHRLRVLFPTGVAADVNWAGEHFDLVVRPIRIPDGVGWSEAPYPTRHLDRFVYLTDGKRGFAVLTGGVTEYEVLDDPARTIALTLVRSVGWLARHDLARRVDRAGPSIATPEAQCLGQHTVAFAVTTAVDLPELLRQSALFSFPARAVAKTSGSGVLPPRMGVIEISPRTLAVTAVKPGADADIVVVRVVNLAASAVTGKLRVGFPLVRAVRLNLNEEIEAVLPVAGDTVEFSAAGKEIVTIGLAPREGRHG